MFIADKGHINSLLMGIPLNIPHALPPAWVLISVYPGSKTKSRQSAPADRNGLYSHLLLQRLSIMRHPGKALNLETIISRKGRQERKGKTTAIQALALSLYLHNYLISFAPLRLCESKCRSLLNTIN